MLTIEGPTGWCWITSGNGVWDLFDDRSCKRCTIWPSARGFSWYVWNAQGVGVGNADAPTLNEAENQARAVLGQGP